MVQVALSRSRQQGCSCRDRTLDRCSVAAILALAFGGVFYVDDNGSYSLMKRTIPIPDTISPELQQLVRESSIDCTSVPTSLQDWRSLRKPVGNGWLREMSDKHRVDVVAREEGGVRCYDVIPRDRRLTGAKRLLLDLHLGGFVYGEGDEAAAEAIVVASQTGYQVLAIEYRLLPDHSFPAAVDDAVAVWNAIIKTIPPSNIGVYGTSAGGGLALSLVQRAIEDGLALPGAVLADSPWADLSKTGDSRYTELDIMSYDGFVAASAKLYANGRDLKDPKLSPVYGNFAKFPPTFLVSGGRDYLLSDTLRVNAKLRQAGVKTVLVVEEGQSHGWLLGSVTVKAPEGGVLFSQIAQFFDDNLSNY